MITSSAWLDGSSLEEEIRKVRAAAATDAPVSPGTGENSLAACAEAAAVVLEVAGTERAAIIGDPEKGLRRLLEGYVAFLDQLASDRGQMPLTPPLNTLQRSRRLLDVLARYEGSAVVDEWSQQMLSVARADQRLAVAHAEVVIHSTVLPFFGACLHGTRDVMWRVNGDSLFLCGLIGAIRRALSASAAPAAQVDEAEDRTAAARSMCCNYVEAAVDGCLAIATEAAPVKPIHASNALGLAERLVCIVRRLSPLLGMDRVFRTTLEPHLGALLQTLAAHAGAGWAEGQAVEKTDCNSVFTSPVTTFTWEEVTNQDYGDACFCEKFE